MPRRLVLDIDDTEDRVHGGQQLALFHAHYDSRCFLPIQGELRCEHAYLVDDLSFHPSETDEPGHLRWMPASGYVSRIAF